MIAIAIMVLCFFLGSRIKNNTVSACIWALFFFTGVYLFSDEILPFFAFLFSAGLTAAGIWIGSRRSSKEQTSPSAIDMSDPAVSALINEAVEVVNDMLEVGTAVTLYGSGKYNGHIYPLIASRPPYGRYTNYGIVIHMFDVDDLHQCKEKYPRMRNNPNLHDLNTNLDRFIYKYSRNYNSAEERYVYETKSTVQLKGDKNKQALTALLWSEIKSRCPLADTDSGRLYTKNVARD